MIYFAWVQKNENFDEQKHARLDEKIVELCFTEKEGEPAEATLQIPNPYALKEKIEIENKKWAWISYKNEEEQIVPLIKVKMTEYIKTHNEGMILKFKMDLNYDSKAYLEQAAKTLKDKWHNQYDDYFADTTLAQQALSVYPHVFYWDRYTHQPEFCNILPSETTLNITKYDLDSLESESEEPISSVDCTVSAQWIQMISGVKNIFPEIEKRFPGQSVESYSPENFEKHWPKNNKTLGQSGYRIIKSYLKTKNEETVCLNQVRMPKHPLQLMSYFLKKKTWTGFLLVGFLFKQRHKADAQFTLKSHYTSQKTKTLVLPLKKVTDDTLYPITNNLKKKNPDSEFVQKRNKIYRYHKQSKKKKKAAFIIDQKRTEALKVLQSNAFFDTQCGENVLNRALARSKTILAAGARTLYIHISGKDLSFFNLSTKQSILINDPRLPFPNIKAKIVSIKMIARFEKTEFWVTLAACLVQDPPTELFSNPSPIESEICLNTTKKEVLPSDLGPSCFFKKLEIVNSIHIKKNSEEQKEMLNDWSKKQSVSQNELHTFNTQIKIELRPLAGQDIIEKSIQLSVNRLFYPSFEKES
jgi:hypothetical protein